MSSPIRFKLNGRDTSVNTLRQRPLLDVLREELQLTGTKYGCGEGRCGACTVLVNGEPTFSCGTPVSDVDGKSIVTIESIASEDALHPVQQAFIEEGASQCGYCTPGMILSAIALLKAQPRPSDEQIVAGMNQNVCRCCNYVNIVAAVRRAAELTSSNGGAR
jgi:aerobic-type carbon monoxide dehydrogenase small subunit (CoxS/CutS family)